MTSFTEANLVKKVQDLNGSAQSIQTLSLWLIHHRKHSKAIVDVWVKELKKVKPPKKLVFLYLANDVVQNSKKKGPEFNTAFKTVFPEAFRHSAGEVDEKTRAAMERLIKIWGERGVFDSSFLIGLKKELRGGEKKEENEKPKERAKERAKEKKEKIKEKSGSGSENTTPKDNNEGAGDALWDRVMAAQNGNKPEKRSHKEKKYVDQRQNRTGKHKYTPSRSAKEGPTKKKKKLELSLIEEVEQEIEKNGMSKEVPTNSELVKSLEDLENSASSDAVVRERIAALPPEVSDAALLDKLKDKREADRLMVQVDDACKILTEYNARLALELEERKKVALRLREFISTQKEALADAEQRLNDHKTKLQQVSSIRKELKSHISSLPDLTLLPDVTGGLAPLPAASDLFSLPGM